MKNKIPRLIMAISVCIVFVANSKTTAGPPMLNPPPGPVSASGRFGVRTAIQAADLPFTISTPGSYYLVENITTAGGGITITANDVTLDLNGFTLRGGTGDGVLVSGFPKKNIEIRNGTVAGWADDGIDAAFCQNCRFEDLRLLGNAGTGLKARDNSVVSGCTAQENGTGISTFAGCAVSNCTARSNTGTGISAGTNNTLADCVSELSGGVGIAVGFGARVHNSVSASSGDDGFQTFADAVVQDCTARNNTGDGIQVSSECRVLNNHCTGNGSGDGAGIHVTGSANRIEGNYCLDADRGLDIDAANNFVAGNTVFRNTDNYDIAAGNRLEILLSQIPESIDWPATVTLAGTLTGVPGQNGITIASDDVTVDLAGHALVGVAGSLEGISGGGAARNNIHITNGVVRNWAADGIDLGSGENHLLSGVYAHANTGLGIRCGLNAVVETCTTSDNGSSGIDCRSGVVTSCTAYQNGSNGIVVANSGTITNSSTLLNTATGITAGVGSVVANCSALGEGADGIRVFFGTTVTACSAGSNGDDGIVLDQRCSVSNCFVSENAGDGIEVSSDCLVVYNTCAGIGAGDGAGIHATGSDNRIEGNNCTDNDRGIDVDAAGNIIVRNTCSGNTTNWDIVANNVYGPIIDRTAPASPAVSGNSAPDSTGSTHPNANFSY